MTLAKEIQSKTTTEKLNAGASFLGKLRDGELLVSDPSAVEQTTSDLTLTNIQINTAAVVLQDCDHVIGQAVLFTVEGGVANTEYVIKCKATSDALGDPTPEVDVKLRVR